MRSLAVEFGGLGLTVNAIVPGWFATESNAEFVAREDIQTFIRTRIPARRWGQPEEIGAAADLLASTAASYINGLILTVDGGLSVSFLTSQPPCRGGGGLTTGQGVIIPV